MAGPLNPRKQTVNLAAPGARPSRIRRNPPATVKEVPIRERSERDSWIVVVGVVVFALALVVVVVGVGSAAGWSPREYTAHL